MTGNVTRLFRSTSLPRRHGLRGWPIAVLGLLGSILISGDTPAATVPPPAADAVPTSDPQRVQAWDLLERLAGGSLAIAAPAASGWFTSEQTVPHAVADRAGTIARVMQSGGEELIVFALYNATAYHHIRNHPVTGRKTTAFPPFPANSAILLTAWWPVARQGLSPLPVWDPDANPPNPAGNGYLTWKRIVAIDPANAAGDGAAASLAFVGRLRGPARRVPLDTFLRVPVDAAMARRLMDDARTRKAMLIALGRTLEPGDSLALVALHAIEKQDDAWIWTTSWWHDAPERGPFARDRPHDLQGPLRHYLMDQVRMNSAAAPGESDRRACFNPWFEARFPDAGEGGGTSSNCIACHSRAGFPAASFLPVRRGVASPGEVASAGTRFTTDFVWSIPRSATKLPRRR